MRNIYRITGTILLTAIFISKSLVAQNTAASVSATGTEFESAVKYNDFIVENQNSIGEVLLSFTALFSGNVPKERFDAEYSQLLTVIRRATANVKAMDGYEGNTRLRDAAYGLFAFYQSVVENEYKSLMELFLSPAADASTNRRMEELIRSVSEREKAYDDEFAAAQKEFAVTHNFSLEENEMQKEFDNDQE